MWVLFAVISLFAYCSADLIAKKNSESAIELIFTTEISAFVIGLLMYACGIGESGLAPWELLIKYPLVLPMTLCSVLYWILFLVSMRFIELSLCEAVGGMLGVYYFLGIVLVYLVSGRLSAVGSLLKSFSLIPAVVMIVLICIFPSVEMWFTKRKSAKTERKATVLGLFIALLAVLCDSANSVLFTTVVDGGEVGGFDCLITRFFFSIVPATVFFVILRIKNGRFYVPFSHNTKAFVLNVFFVILSSVTFLVASMYNAVGTGILFICYPVLPILGAKLLLKERYSWRQNACIWVIVICSVLFCILS